MNNKYKYKATFSSEILASGKIDTPELNISKASLDGLKDLLPDDVNLEENVDLIAVAFNAALVNKFNKNGDGISAETAVEVIDQFKHKPTNIEHNREKVVGHIVTSSFSDLQTGEIISNEEALAYKQPFNISLGSLVYKAVNKEFAELVEKSVDPDSQYYHKVSASWEIGFNDYVLAIGSDDLENAEIISDPDQIEEYKHFLKSFDGDGKFKDGRNIYRLIVGDVLPLGIGFTANPAAEVKGLITKNSKQNTEDVIDEEIEDNKKIEKNISQIEKTTVNNRKHTIMENQDILNDLVSALKEKASEGKFSEEAVATVSKIIKEAILEKNDSFVKEKEELLTEKEKLTLANEEHEKQAQAFQDQLNDALEKVAVLEQGQVERAAIDRFDSRMSVIEDTYELNDETRVVVARELKDVEETEEAFAQYQDRISVVLKHQNKQFIEEQQKAFDEKLAEAVEKRIQELNNSDASEEEVVEEAIEKVEPETETVANNNGESAEEEVTLRDKFKAAFSEDNLTIKY